MQNEKLFEDTETETDSASVNEGAEDMQAVAEEKPKPEAKPTKKQQFIQIVKFTLFSASAGVIQLVSTSVLHEWTGWLVGYYYIA